MTGIEPAYSYLLDRCSANMSNTGMERVTGFEPARSVWKTDMLPLNITPARWLPPESNRDLTGFNRLRCQLR